MIWNNRFGYNEIEMKGTFYWYITGISNFHVFHNIKEHYRKDVFYNVDINILSNTLVKVVLLPFTMHYVELLWVIEQSSSI